VEPARFLLLAERAGLGVELGRQVLECGLDAVAGWYADGYPVGRLAVNLAQSQLDSPDFVDTVTAQLARRELPAGALMAELAAGSFLPTAQAIRTLEQLTAVGVQLLLDDFGVPGVSVSGLSELPLSGVKLDPGLTWDSSSSAPGSAAAASLALCRSLGLRSIVEGIETPGQLTQARELGADAGQGYLLGRPARARDLTARFAESRRSAGRPIARVPGQGVRQPVGR
jgi:EAL domain-containing protein (putative c-di-GMP-specific phosphodiesterase class I)